MLLSLSLTEKTVSFVIKRALFDYYTHVNSVHFSA